MDVRAGQPFRCEMALRAAGKHSPQSTPQALVVNSKVAQARHPRFRVAILWCCVLLVEASS